MDLTDFSDIAPFSDEEAAAALTRLSNHPNTKWVSKVIFPDKPETFLGEVLRSIHTVEEFQGIVMNKAINWVVETSMKEYTYEGFEKLENMDRKYLAMSNHRDIILDPALTQITLQRYHLPETQICVGDNLLKVKSVELLIRSNRMIKVIRGISARELYLSSQLLSRYIRETITSGTASVWIAQRQGRTKDGLDTTEQGLLKMLDMSGKGDFVQNFLDLNIVPMSVSYEYEPCDIMKARELLISRTQKYVKGETEDLESIMMGIKQYKGRVHLCVNDPLTEEEIRAAADCDKNDRYQLIRHVVDRKIIGGYKLWKTNYMAYDLVNGGKKYADQYTAEDLETFKSYIAQRLLMVEPSLNKHELRDIFLHIYSNPVLSKEQLTDEQ